MPGMRKHSAAMASADDPRLWQSSCMGSGGRSPWSRSNCTRVCARDSDGLESSCMDAGSVGDRRSHVACFAPRRGDRSRTRHLELPSARERGLRICRGHLDSCYRCDEHRWRDARRPLGSWDTLCIDRGEHSHSRRRSSHWRAVASSAHFKMMHGAQRASRSPLACTPAPSPAPGGGGVRAADGGGFLASSCSQPHRAADDAQTHRAFGAPLRRDPIV